MAIYNQQLFQGGDPNENFDAYMNNTLTNASTTATTIPQRCFFDKSQLIDFSMPNVTSIEAQAFQGCTSLTSVGLSSNLTSIKVLGFYNCTSLALTELPSNLSLIENDVFNGCVSLALTALPNNITSIKSGSFGGCTSLALTELPSGVTSIGNTAFFNCISLALTSLPSGLTSIGAYAFYKCTSIPYLDISELVAVPSLANANAFAETTFPFYFADQTQLDSFASATNWSALADRFQVKAEGGGKLLSSEWEVAESDGVISYLDTQTGDRVWFVQEVRV